MAKEVTLESLNATLDTVIARATASLDKFKERLGETPEYAFEWGTDALASAATLRVVEEAKHYANLDNEVEGKPVTFEERLTNMRRYFTDSAMRASEQVPASTSAMSNLVENYRRQALVKLVHTLNGEYFSGF